MTAWTDTLLKTASGSWDVAMEMAPYLLFGFFMAGLLHVFLPRSFIENHLGSNRTVGILKAALIGVPMPLCSCSVIPVATSLRRHGAGRGATISFLASTPQTGVDSIAATYGMMGPVMAAVRVLAAFISGIVCGLLANLFDRDEKPPAASGNDCGCCRATADRPAWWRILHYGFVELPRDISGALLIGLLLAGLLGTVLPSDFFSAWFASRWSALPAVIAFSIPLYVCSTGSIPLAFAFIRAGLSPGLALVFLMLGPATNVATVTTMWKEIGPRFVIIYLAGLTGCAVLAGLLFDLLPLAEQVSSHVATHAMETAWWKPVAAVALLALLIPSWLSKHLR